MCRNASGNHLALRERQCQPGATPLGRTNATMRSSARPMMLNRPAVESGRYQKTTDRLGMSEIVEEAWKPQRFQARNRSGRSAMTVHPLFEPFSVGPDEINRLAEAYKLTLEALRLRDRDDAMTRKVARSIIDISQTGVSDPAELSRLAIKQLNTP
jgi:hypothetical protein